VTDTDIWVRTAPDIDWVYRACIEFDADTSLGLDDETAAAHALTVMAAVAACEYDAAVIRQAVALGVHPHVGVELVLEMRNVRGPFRIGPVELVPGVSQRDRRGFLLLVRDGNPVGQWEVGAARGHAQAVLESVACGRLDTAYWMALRKVAGVDPDVAGRTVEALGAVRRQR